VKIIEMNPARCRYLSETLDSTIVLQGSASDKDLLVEENISDADIFLALTNDDEANIMSSLLAKRLGARKVMTMINNPAYVDLVQGGEIDIAISPQLGHHRHPADPCAARRYRKRALAAPRCRRGHRGDRPR
jgi:trk system potassium uptake protein